MMTVELMLALFLWVIFLSGIISLWFVLFGPNIPLFEYVENETFLVNSMTDELTNESGILVDRDIEFVTSVKGLKTLRINHQQSFGQKSCRGLNVESLQSANMTSIIELDNQNSATAAIVRGLTIFLTSNSSSTTDPDFYVISIEDRRAPKIVSSMNTGPGLSSIAVAGYVAYVSNTSINSQAQAIDISNPLNPILKWSFKVPGSQGTSTSLGRVIATDGKRVFLGTAKNASQELYSLDPMTGQLLSSFEISGGVNGLYLNGSTLYVASPVDPELMVLDVSERESMRLIGQYDAVGGSGNGKSIERATDSLLLGRTLGGNELISLDIASSSNIRKNSDAKIGSTVDSMIAAKNVLYTLTAHAQKELQIWKTTDGKLSVEQTIDLPSRGVGIGCSDGFLYTILGTRTPLHMFEPAI